MPSGHLVTVTSGLILVALVAASCYFAASVLAPVALALFIIAAVWPIQSWLQERLPKAVALVATLLITVAICLAIGTLAVYAFGRVGHSLATDASRYQALYDNLIAQLESWGITVSGVWTDHLNVSWMLRTAQQITGRLNTTLTFWFVTLAYVLLGLLEVGDMRRRLGLLANQDAARLVIEACVQTAAKFRKYLWVRAQMSAVTGLLVWLLTWMTGLQFSAEWGVMAFVLNFIPIIGPFAATMLPTLFATLEFGSWMAVLGLFLGLNLIQIVVGTFVEPRVAGASLSVSPTLVLFSVFFWAFLWGLFGAFIGVPIMIAILTFCALHPASAWIATVLGGEREAADGT